VSSIERHVNVDWVGGGREPPRRDECHLDHP
jgi:hypothetical protein